MSNKSEVFLSNVRLSFAAHFKAEAFAGEGEPKFSDTFLFAPDHPCVKLIKAAMSAVAQEKWKDEAKKVVAELIAGDRVALRKGDDKPKYGDYPGNLYIKASNKTRPLVINNDKSPLTAEDGKPYSGCYVNATIEFWAQDNQFGKRINATLTGIQFLRDGEAFSGGRAASPDEFADLSGLDDEPGTPAGNGEEDNSDLF